MSIIESCSKPINKDSIKGISPKQLVSMYEMMLKIRLVEDYIGRMVARREVKTPCHLYLGQEAVAVGVCAHLKKDDFVFSTHRSHGHYLAKGGDLKSLMAEIFGKATGCCRGRGGSMHIAQPSLGLPGSSAIVGGTIPLAVGAGLGISLKSRPNVAVAFFGDGATNEGIFYESLNFARLKNLPVIFICENNFYSTHMHISKIQAVSQLYKIGELFDIPSFQVNGYNIIEVYTLAKKTIETAKKGKGPVFVEAFTYRWRGHVGPNWDLDTNIRAKEEVYWWVKNCTIKRLERLLLGEKILNSKKRKDIFRKLHAEIRQAIKFAKESPYPDKKELKDVYA
ncbi:MAG: thiamine pyrophosphate-dependent dehydrogenase E1 component subunit alpha [Candidatus Omnitrophica bacterium]|nr:thiamine pyrophosphate-dependent dehydrogenase E1 component subunit alpha [Candidatus Omnitrophota bacterium]